jgi:plastocyanin
MSRTSILIGGVGVAITIAGAVVAGGSAVPRLLDPASPAQAVTSHAMMNHAAPPTTAKLAAAAANQVVVDNFSFGPTTLTVAAGTKVTWTNDDDDLHTVVSETDPKLFKSPALDTGDSYSFTFDKPGTYRYFCSLHPHMQGVVVVK